ncbi:hypothetical protein Y032_0024g1043 [Ancylostoma ceylanicum]|uniref:Uncharacterized protein n=1 Tax=Ancylostoma ceylanicum TaxID=53326 RepID=A0A016UX49_9BILA|nr:hypothetical protein Y032_0024g1043 [Ancylostoma ceylanicum]
MHLFVGVVLFYVISLLEQAEAVPIETSDQRDKSAMIGEHQERTGEQIFPETTTGQKVLKSRGVKLENVKKEESTDESDDEETSTDHKSLGHHETDMSDYIYDEEPSSPARNTGTAVRGKHIKASRMLRVNARRPQDSQRRDYPGGLSYKVYHRNKNGHHNRKRKGGRKSGTETYGKYRKQKSKGKKQHKRNYDGYQKNTAQRKHRRGGYHQRQDPKVTRNRSRRQIQDLFTYNRN